MTADEPVDGTGDPVDEPIDEPIADAADDGFDDPIRRLRELAGDDPRVQAGVEHLQRAAHEAIAASRALLDVAEELVADPRALGGLLGALGSVGDLAAHLGAGGRRAARSRAGGWGSGDGDDLDHPDDDEPPVQRIPVS